MSLPGDDLPSRVDVVVIGSGAGGATVAGELARKGCSVAVIEAGGAGTGAHGRNLDSTPEGTRAFADYLDGVLTPLNGAGTTPPRLPGLVGVHGVGGMLVGWTHNAPAPDWWELPAWIDHDRWNGLVARASELIHVGTAYSSEDPRYARFEELVARQTGELPAGREVQPMPVAAERRPGGGWRFSAADDLLAGADANIRLITDHVVREVVHSGDVASGVRAYPVGGGAPVVIAADAVVIAAGTAGSAQIISASQLQAGPALGKYLTEHTIVATRVHLREDLKRSGSSPLFPPGVWIPSSLSHPWSTTINATQWNFNPAIPAEASFDNTIDLLSFCPVEPQESNSLTFDATALDGFGLPGISGKVELSANDIATTADALRELYVLSNELGDLVSGWGMRVPARGGSMHLMGSCRMGSTESDSSVVSPEGRLWGYANCYVAGNAVLGERNASNPTLSTIAFALNTADAILNRTAPSLAVGREVSL